MRPLHIARNVMRALALAAVFVGTLEACARIDDYLRYGAPILATYGPQRLRTITPDGLPANVPGARFEKWENNEFGFRGPPVARSKRPGVVRVAVMGTSESYGLYEDPGYEWPALLDSALSRGGDFEVLNASVVGLSFQHYRRYIRERVAPLAPDRVVLLVNPYGYVQFVRNLERERRAVTPSSQRRPGAQHPARFSPRIAMKLTSTVRRAVPARVLAKILVWRKQRRITALERAHLAGAQPVDSMPSAYAERFSADLDSLVRAVRSLGMEPILCTYPGLLSEAGTPEVRDACLDRRTYLIEYSCAGLVVIFRPIVGQDFAV